MGVTGQSRGHFGVLWVSQGDRKAGGGGGGERVSQGAYGGMRSARERMGVRGQSGGIGGKGSVREHMGGGG